MKKILLIIAGLILATGIVSAYDIFGGYGSFVPEDLLNNQLFLFVAIFLISFIIVYMSILPIFTKKYKPVPWEVKKEVAFGPSAVLAGIIALGIAAAVTQKIRLYGYFGDEIGSWIVVFAVLLVAVFLLKVIHSYFKPYGIPIALIISWFILKNIDPYTILPYSLLTSGFERFYETAIDNFTLFILVLLLVIVIAYQWKKNSRHP